MNSLFPHAAYEEDQRFARSILTLHVLSRGFTTGATISLAITTASTLLTQPRTWAAFGRKALISSSRGAVIGLIASDLALTARMWGREKIEWQSRAWRLQENRGQSEVDKWVTAGEVVGIAAVVLAARTGRLPPGLGTKRVPAMATAVVGAAGLGSVAGTVEYVVWRHGIKRGKWAEVPESVKTGVESAERGMGVKSTT
ncbi:hypothetical protein H2201_007653 [Coniosporium apollinis]|uniref:Uncharacterized protein n=1 Tax=Coniosporium apollinis TaxID=61459 RepID=A0ABQ9NNQ1_9PEZI|nr:hypothetical protein H2201_007653 [Coniosporium apollinis]